MYIIYILIYIYIYIRYIDAREASRDLGEARRRCYVRLSARCALVAEARERRVVARLLSPARLVRRATTAARGFGATDERRAVHVSRVQAGDRK